MTAYIHIGTEKTGTTSIQTFLSNNRDLLKKQEIIYPSSLGNNGSQWDFTFLAYDNIRSDEYCIGRKIYTKHDFKNHKKKVFFDLKKELKKAKCQELLISSEHLSSRLQDLKEIKRCKKILNILGFKEIKILVYLREQNSEVASAFSTTIKSGGSLNNIQINPGKYNRGKYDLLLFKWQEVFDKENIITRLFDKNEFYQGDLLKDFIHNIGLQWDDEFIIPPKENESLDLIGIELLKRINKHLPWQVENKINHLRGDITSFVVKYFQNFKDPHLKFQISKEIMQAYTDCFEESNEWVRKEFFPHKERLFPKKDLSNYKENYELKEMKPEYWDRIAEFIADIVSTKNQNIADKTIIIQNKDKVIVNQTNQINSLQTVLKDNEIKLTQAQNLNNILNKTIQEKDIIINSNTNQIDQLQNNIQKNSVQINKLQSKLSFQTQCGTAKSRIQNQLSYKLGQAMIVNSKSILGYIRMPFVLSYIKDKHKQEQKIYQEKIKKDPSLKLPPLESYPDYKEALKEKECLTYKLGEALIRANNNWYGGGISNCGLRLGS
ncbi:hypothetical protein [Campylobacter coli]|uniref:hypothetical protein n=1 Tax=Campylobacter coli TaxID=195 RepID=UPI000B003F1F